MISNRHDSDGYLKQGLHIDIYGGHRWFKDGRLHREDGPAFISSKEHFYIWVWNGEQFPNIRTYCQIRNFSEEETLLFMLKHSDYP